IQCGGLGNPGDPARTGYAGPAHGGGSMSSSYAVGATTAGGRTMGPLRLRPRLSVALTLTLVAAVACSTRSERPHVLNRQAELFLNDRAWIEASDGVALAPASVRRHPA